MRSRTGSLPCSRCRSTYFAPAALARLRQALRAARATSCGIRSRLAANTGLRGRRATRVLAHHQPQQSVLKPQAGQRQTACIRYISAPQRSQSILSPQLSRR